MDSDWKELRRFPGFVVGLVSSPGQHFAPYIEVADDEWDWSITLLPSADRGTVSPGFAGKSPGDDRRASYSSDLHLECRNGEITIAENGELAAEAAPGWMRVPGSPDPFNFRTAFKVQLPQSAVPAVRFAILEAFKQADANASTS